MKNALVDGLINPRRQWSCIQALPFFFFFFSLTLEIERIISFVAVKVDRAERNLKSNWTRDHVNEISSWGKRREKKIQWDKSSKCLRLTRYLVIVGIVKAEFVRPFQAYQISVVLIRRRQVQWITSWLSSRGCSRPLAMIRPITYWSW